MQYILNILGCGHSTGVPNLDVGYGHCNSNNIKNNRLRSSLYFTITLKNITTKILIDCSPDFRVQALNNNIKHIDYMLLTHQHADHIYGIHELRGINKLMQLPITTYLTKSTMYGIKKAFYYLFDNTNGKGEDNVFFRTALNFKIIKKNTQSIKINNINVDISRHIHGNIETIGFIFNKTIGYISDFSHINENEINKFKNIELLIIACTTINESYLHASFNKVIEIINKINPKKAILVHMGLSLDYDILKNTLPSHIEPAFDNMIIKNF